MGIYYLQKLYKKTATGAIQSWLIGVEGTTIVTTYGQVDGKIQSTRDSIKSGKNLGRKNATGAAEQAQMEAMARWEKKKKAGYVGSIESAEKGQVGDEIEGGIVPMLAKVYEDHSLKIGNKEVAVQPKLDGGRMIAVIAEDFSVSLWTRTRKRIYSMNHVADRLATVAKKKNWKNLELDGEAYLHGKDNFEQLMSAFRKERTTPESEKLQYWVYDCVRDENFKNRLGFIADLHLIGGSMVRLVDTDFVTGEDKIMELHEKHVSAGYEGAMVRLLDRPYENKRSDQLLKLKKFLDEEFTILGLEEGRGKLIGHCGAFVCCAGEENFRVKMSGELSRLKEYWENQEKYVGQLLTVKFQSKTAYGVPRFPVGLRIREDL